MRSFQSLSWLLILVPMALFVGCGDGCGKKEKTTATPAAQGGGATPAATEAAAAEKSDEPAAATTDAGSSENLEDTAAYVTLAHIKKARETQCRLQIR